MLIRMTNPKHGAMHVYSETDALRHEQLGWVREVPEAALESLVDAEASERLMRAAADAAMPAVKASIEADLAAIPLRKKPGHKPKGA